MNLDHITKAPDNVYTYAVVYRLYRDGAASPVRHVTFDTVIEAKSASYGMRRYTTFNAIYRLDAGEVMDDKLAQQAYNMPAREVAV
jgi:hypothetical protein